MITALTGPRYERRNIKSIKTSDSREVEFPYILTQGPIKHLLTMDHDTPFSESVKNDAYTGQSCSRVVSLQIHKEFVRILKPLA
jgi:hypothetical protein